MFLMRFTERAYTNYTEEAVRNSTNEAVRLTFSNSNFDPKVGARQYNEYLDEYEYCEEVGFDGLMLNEHHNTPTCLGATMNLEAAILARNTTKPKIVLMGNPLPTFENPLRVAEEIAEIDMISNGRVVSGFVRGTGVESLAANINPLHNRERFEECHDLIIKTWTTPGPFRWEGKHYQYRAVNPWMVPVQKPHPPAWVPGTGSPETVEWAVKHRYTYAAFLTELSRAKELFGSYREQAAQQGWEAGPDKFAFMICAHVNETDEKAQESGKAFMWRMGHPLKGPKEYWAPPGYFSRAGTNANAARRQRPLNELSYQELQDDYHLVVGSPDTVIKKLRHIKEELGIGSLLLETQGGPLSHEDTMRSIKLMGEEVIPALQD